MNDKAFRRFVAQIHVACESYLAETDGILADPRGLPLAAMPALDRLMTKKQSARSASVKGNPICKCGHNYSVHDEPRDVHKIPQNICRGCHADGSKIGCPEFVSKRGGAPSQAKSNGTSDERGFTACHRAILAALNANHHQSWTAQQISILTVYTQSGTFNMALADLRELNLIEGSPIMQLTVEGFRVAAAADVAAAVRNYSGNALRIAWSAKLGQTVSRVLETLAKHGSMSVSDLAERSRYTQSGTFNQTLAKLRRMGLIERGQPVRLGAELT